MARGRPRSIHPVMALLGAAPATDVAFGVVFGLFVLAVVVLAVLTIRWAVRRDRPGREAWKARSLARRAGAAPPSSNGPGLVEGPGERP
jgi:membrane protein implicated in regulation of membrane protease activity